MRSDELSTVGGVDGLSGIGDGWLFYGREEPHTEIHPGHMGTVVNEGSHTYEVEWDGMPTLQEAFPDYTLM